jgi:hypothetical protein
MAVAKIDANPTVRHPLRLVAEAQLLGQLAETFQTLLVLLVLLILLVGL